MQKEAQKADAAERPRVSPCWSCQGPVPGEALFCHTCQAVQPPGGDDHFSRLGLDTDFDVDVAALERRYFDLQRQLHPDRFATRTARERLLSQQQATSLNEAFETLKDPLRRADYLVHLKGAGVLPEGCDAVNDPVILMEAMELREALAEAEASHEVDAIARRTREDIDECIAELSRAFDAEDLEGACRLTTRLKYLRKLGDEIRARRAKLASND
ncbi:MAG: Fe-S protein assembly co-chaperone HscB [Hyphomicrobiales bacterium]|nr:Fe-S protein assembly co-chaperone HscB [Hyphomicrobiales bacterium]